MEPWKTFVWITVVTTVHFIVKTLVEVECKQECSHFSWATEEECRDAPVETVAVSGEVTLARTETQYGATMAPLRRHNGNVSTISAAVSYNDSITSCKLYNALKQRNVVDRKAQCDTLSTRPSCKGCKVTIIIYLL